VFGLVISCTCVGLADYGMNAPPSGPIQIRCQRSALRGDRLIQIYWDLHRSQAWNRCECKSGIGRTCWLQVQR